MSSLNFLRVRRIYQLLLIVGLCLGWNWTDAYAQSMVFSAEAQREVVGIQDRVVVSYHLENFPEDVSQPRVDFEGFRHLGGPYESVSRQTEIINGRTSRKFIKSYTYELQATATGVFQIPPAEVVVDGQRYRSNAIRIEVREGTLQAPPPTRQRTHPQLRMRDPFEELDEWMRQLEEDFWGRRPQAPAAPQTDYRAFTEDKLHENLFIRMETDKNEVYEGEPIFVSYKLYTRLPMNMAISKAPDLRGFWNEDFDMPDRPIPETKMVNGKEYQVFTLKKSVLYPQLKGTLTLDPAEAKGKVGVAELQQDQWGRAYINQKDVEAHIKSKPVNVQVKALPTLPNEVEQYQGAVGNIERDIEIDRTNSDIEAPIAITIKYKGVGNLALISAPELKVPEALFYAAPESEKKFDLTARGLSGEVTFKYFVYANNAGTFEIEVPSDANFEYQNGQYKKMKSASFTVQFDGEIVSTEEQAIVDDIRFLKTNHQRKALTFLHPIWILLSGLFLIIAWLFSKKQAEGNPILGFMKNRTKKNKAQKEAWRRLKIAAQHLEQKETSQFYEAVLKALILFISDKLNIPLAHLSKDTYKQALLEKEIPYEHWESIEKVVEQSEMVLYAGGVSSEKSMNETLEEAQNAMVHLQSFLKDKKS